MTTILDETLFGVRDFGKMTLVQLKTLHDQMYGCNDYTPNPIAEWLCSFDFWYGCIHSANDVFPNEPASVKHKQMVEHLAFPEYEYRVKFDIRPSTTTLPIARNYRDIFAVDIWIDDILMNDSTKEDFTWFFLYHKYNDFRAIPTLNAAHKKYLHDLYYAEFRANMARIAEELVAAAMHPRRLTRYLELGGEIDDW